MHRFFQSVRNKITLRHLQFLIAAIIVVLLVLSVNPGALSRFLFHTSPLFLLLAMAFYLVNNLLMTYRLKRVLTFLGHKLRFRMTFSSHMAGMIFSDVTPARSGYLYAAYDLSRKGIPLPRAMVSVTGTYVFDLIFKSLIAALGILYFYSSLFPLDARMYLLLLFGFIAAGILLYAFITRAPQGVRGPLQRYRIFHLLFQYGDESRTLHRISPFILGISFLGWISRGFEWYCVAAALGIASFSILDGLFLNPLLTLLSLIPVTPAGIGIQEAGIVGLFLLISIDRVAATSFALLTRAIEALIDAVGLASFYRSRVEHKDLHAFYGSIDGDIDERSYNSDLFVQRYFQQRRTAAIMEHLEVGRGDVFLDIGCGSGVQMAMFARKDYALAIGIDLNRNALSYARKRGLPNSEFIMADAGHLPFKAGVIRKILCAEVIEHMDRPDGLVQEMKRVLGTGGEIVVTTPNENSPWGVYEFAWDVFGRGRNYADTHLKFYSPREIRELFQAFPEKEVETLFFLSPFVALLNNNALVSAAERIDSLFERWSLGVLIIAHVKLGSPDRALSTREGVE
ncbi:MAG TPA: flippase-like domain-containing protein [Methanomicrobiales archaeon]|nr:flippase-like domain-containing protein [Methanomicrobiales archaeon]